MIITYKTRREAFDNCDRYGYLKYMFMGTGVEADVRGIEMAVGSSIHAGVDEIWKTSSIEQGVAAALASYQDELNEGLFKNAPADSAAAVQREQRWVIEGVLRLWHAVRYPKLLSEYRYAGGEFKVVTPLSSTVSSLAKPDGILQSLADNRFYNWSLKTEKSHGYIKHPKALIDLGGLTEAIAAAMSVGGGDLKNIAGTLMEYLVVGKFDDDEPIIWHPTIRGWRKSQGDEIAWKWKFDNPDYDPTLPPHRTKNSKTKSLSGKDGWMRFEAADYKSAWTGKTGIAGWVEDLVGGRFLPRGVDPLKDLIHAPGPYTRTQSAIEDFVREEIALTERYDQFNNAVNDGTMSLDAAFPKRRRSCVQFGERYRCEMWDICYEGAGTDPFNRGYRPRLSSAEREAIRSKK